MRSSSAASRSSSSRCDLGLRERLVGEVGERRAAPAARAPRAAARALRPPARRARLARRAARTRPGRARRVDSERRSPAAASRARSAPSALRSCGDPFWSDVTAVCGGCSPHSASTSRSVGTTRFAWRSSSASSARCLLRRRCATGRRRRDLERPEDAELPVCDCSRWLGSEAMARGQAAPRCRHVANCGRPSQAPGWRAVSRRLAAPPTVAPWRSRCRCSPPSRSSRSWRRAHPRPTDARCRRAAARPPTVHRTRAPDDPGAFRRESYRPGDRARLAFATARRAPAAGLPRGPSGPPRRRARRHVGRARLARRAALGRVARRPRRHRPRRRLAERRLLRAARRRRTAASASRRSSCGRARLGEHRVAVVMPTQTWQAYNFRDDDGDGTRRHLVRRRKRHRPPRPRRSSTAACRRTSELRRAVPALARRGPAARPTSSPTTTSSGRERQPRCAAPTTLVVFPGHHEYVTEHEYDAVTRLPRPRRQPDVPLREQLLLEDHASHDDVMTRVAHVARPRPARGGADRRPVLPQRPRRASRPLGRRARRAAVALRRHRARDRGSRSRAAASRSTASTPSSPRGMRVVAEIPNLFGPGARRR